MIKTKDIVTGLPPQKKEKKEKKKRKGKSHNKLTD